VAGNEVASMIHIHNGDIVAALARRSGIQGQHVVYRESLVTGPVVPGDEWIELRARALVSRSDQDLLRVRTEVLEQEQMLDAAPASGEIVLWFEHDLYCLTHLLHLLQRFGDARQLSVIWSREPLGNKDTDALYAHYESRAAVPPSMIDAARGAWRAYTSPDPTALNDWIDHDAPDFPFLREGLTLHASRFPSRQNGLGRIESHALELIDGGVGDFGTIFDQINARVPRFGFGDTEVFHVLRAMATCAVPLVVMSGELPKVLFSITPAGENVLRGEVDNVKINDPDVWLGGAHVTKEDVWRWDGFRVSRSPAS
jgi:hypothetical protein